MQTQTVAETIRELYMGETPRAHRFRYGVLIFDAVTILFVIVTSFFPHYPAIELADAAFGVLILADFLIRLRLENGRPLLRPSGWADVVAILSFLAPVAGEGLGFLRVLRTLRLLHSYQLAARLRRDSRFFRTHQDVILATVNLGVFLFVMTGFIYVSQFGINEEIRNYADALYFTVTTLTTTGFGDITMEGTYGRILSVAVMIVGVTLFLRLLQVLFRPTKVRQECSTCGLLLHDIDAVHCKHCGEVIHIRNEGVY